MKINDSTFYVVDTGDDKHVLQSEEDAVQQMKTTAGQVEDPEQVSIFEVDIAGEEWAITQVPWSKIALQMMKA